MSELPAKVKIVEVGPRDGLQNEKTFIETQVKIQLIDLLSATGLSAIEVSSFVSPKRIPQLKDAAEVFEQIELKENVRYSALTPNLRGMEAAIAAKVKEVAVFSAASESFCQKNINCSIQESLQRFEPVMALARQYDIAVRGYISCVAGCPYEGEVKPEMVASVTQELIAMGCYEVSLGDTTGVGTVSVIQAMLDAVLGEVKSNQLAVHFHDTYGQALVNLYAALQMGIHTIDSAVAGLGGCPYAQGATGNVATEDVLYFLNGLNIETGIDMQGLLKASNYISNCLGRPAASRVACALNA